jgi:phospholipase/lecithinase/hemolysin
MKLLRHFFISVLLVFVSLFSLSAVANEIPTYNQIIIFGDSLSDDGNLYNTTLGFIPKSPPYYQGHFSNGPVWSDSVGSYFSDKNHVSTVNYAVGGETVNFHNPFSGFLPYTFSNSLNSYYLHTAFQDRSHTLFIVWLGANDYLNGTNDPDQATTDVIATIQENIESLIRSGGKSFLVMNLPDLAVVPFTSANTTRAELHTLTLLNNNKLRMAVEELRQEYPEINIQLFDVYSIYEDLANNLTAYNQKYHTQIKNMTDPCWEGGYYTKAGLQGMEDEIRRDLEANEQQKMAKGLAGKTKATQDFHALAHYIATSPDLRESYMVSKSFAGGKTACEQPDDYAFWDHVHPTAPVHRIISSILIEKINQFYHVES